MSWLGSAQLPEPIKLGRPERLWAGEPMQDCEKWQAGGTTCVVCLIGIF
jgi:hypothetical protein